MYIYAETGAHSLQHSKHFVHVALPQVYVIKPNDWLISVCELRVHRDQNTEGYYAIKIRGTTPQSFNSQSVPVVRTFSITPRPDEKAEIIEHSEFIHQHYIPIGVPNLKGFDISIEHIDGDPVDKICKVWLVLHMKHK